ncbi:MAG TPA: TonB-dependent receptor plug domain-containing protein, partial [Thermoanaerobaculia bacterium]|nr:TonB-dependent receptor plug domain-containing protein [Thermoanaerobaculia bacterium]
MRSPIPGGWLRSRAAAIILLLFCSISRTAHSEEAPVRLLPGMVTDWTGAPVAAAAVQVISEGYSAPAVTDSRGRFQLIVPNGQSITLSVEKPGFRRSGRTIAREDLEREVRIALEPASVSDEVVVTATRSPARLGGTAASVLVVTAGDLESSAAPTIDDVLRQVPGFALFRRSGSRTANPTSQGVSLRGTGASGASRAVVLADGVPLNDPFGGWVYWGRVPRASLERVEVLRG